MFLMKNTSYQRSFLSNFHEICDFFPQPAYNSPTVGKLTLCSREKRTSIFTGGCRKEVDFVMWDKLALILLIIGGVNWGLVGVFEFVLVAWLFGGAAVFHQPCPFIFLWRSPHCGA